MAKETEEFNEEIIQKLPSEFKIPLKTLSKDLTKYAEECADVEENKDEIDDYISPLQIVEESISEMISESENLQNDETTNRKRKSIPPASNLDKHSKETKSPSLKLPGRSPEFPDALNELLQPLVCNLCSARFTSIKVAGPHYESKSHMKKITAWLTDWTSQTGESMPKIPKLIKDGKCGPNAFHCEACDLPLTSLHHANQHYSGKRHHMVVANISKPSGSGYYDSNGKWIRTATKINTDSRYGIGESFRKQNEIETKLEPEKTKNENPSMYCNVCSVSLSSELQMQDHLKGSKHAKKLKLSENQSYVPRTDTILAKLNSVEKDDMSMYRTPTGSYYCKICNISLLDPAQMKQHLSGKRHIKKQRSSGQCNGGDSTSKMAK